jgi:hypothetical protein
MKTIHSLFAILATSMLAACPATVVRDHRPPPGGGGGGGVVNPPPGTIFDSNGWTLLASSTVDGAKDRDVLKVGGAAGRYDLLTMVVYDSDLELNEFNIRFGNNEVFSPPVRHVFREGTRTRAIDLPGENRGIKSFEIVYANIPGGGRARVEIWGKDTGSPGRPPVAVVEPPPPAPVPAPPPPEPAFDPAGWTLLGSHTVEGKKDKDVIPVGKKAGIFDRITVVVTDSDLELSSLVVNFSNGTKFEPEVRTVFQEGTRSRVIDLPGNNRNIKTIVLKYGNLPGGGKAKVEVYAKNGTKNDK